ncbi:hypothetical protein HOY80DRAFT_1089855 [Tuber brumale]|nr:hypothetical protein HOY80DRAFT_1089855 [Tuber brumale]
MEDWGSPWADDEKLGDKDDRPGRELPPKVKDVEAEEEEEEEEEGSYLGKEGEEEVVVTPVMEEKQDVGAAALTVDWINGFADSSAWASATPRVQVEDGDSFGWGALGPEGFTGVGAKVGGDSGEEGEGRIEDDWRGSDKSEGLKTANLHPIATDEVNAWGAGSDWGDPRTPRTPEPRIEGMNDALGLSLDEVGDNTPDGAFDAEVKDLPTPDVERHDQLIGAANLLNSPTKQLVNDEETQNVEQSSADDLQAVLEAVSDPTSSETQEDSKNASSPPLEPHPATPSTREANSLKDSSTSVSASDQGDDEDDFGDFAAEGGGGFEEPQASMPEPVLPAAIKAPPPGSFEVDISLVSKLYPIPTSRPDLPPIEEIISTTDSRKTWYRLSTSGTIRRNRSGDDNYVRVMWVGSKVQEGVNKIVEKWMTEDRNSGGGGLMGGGKRVSAMFGWGDSSSKTSDQKPISLEKAAPQFPSGGRSRKASGPRSVSISTQSLLPKPTSLGTPSSSESVGGGSVPSHQVANFGWGSTQPRSGPGSVEGDEKTPSTPLRTNLHSSTRHSLSPRLTPHKISPAPPPPPMTASGSAGSSMAAASTALSPTLSPTVGTKNCHIAPAPEFLPAVDNSITADPLPAALPADAQAAGLASASGFGDWSALENMSANAPPASGNSQSCNYDERGAFEGLAVSGSSSSAPNEVAPAIGSQNPPVATNVKFAVPAPTLAAQPSPEPAKRLNPAQTSLEPADTAIDGWGDLESLSSQPPKFQTLSNISSSHAPIDQNTNSLAWSESKDRKTSQSGLVEDSREGSRLSIPPTPNMSDGGSFNSASINRSASDGIKKNPVISNVQTQQDSGEDDDWGEMVQSPIMPTGVFGFSEALRVPAPAPSQNITSLGASTPPTSLIPQPMPALGLAPAPPLAPTQAIQPTSALSTTLSSSDFGQKSESSIGDSWDLSFFEESPIPNSGFSIPKDIPESASQDLWDTPAVGQGKAKESANDRAVREIVEGLPDLSYMLG